MCYIIELVSLRIVIIPEKIEEEFNDYYKTGNEENINEGKDEFYQKMKIRYIAYGIFTGLISLFLWYYVIVFCSVYNSSSLGWIQGVFITLTIDLIGLEIGVPFLLAVFREIFKSFPSFR